MTAPFFEDSSVLVYEYVWIFYYTPVYDQNYHKFTIIA